jgi:hypothetical protein
VLRSEHRDLGYVEFYRQSVILRRLWDRELSRFTFVVRLSKSSLMPR